jgi:cation diffusion facilitator CzcD-associated flavoprotein CzcO
VSAQNGTRLLKVAIVGAGFGGLGLAIRLKQEGFYDFTIFERGDSVGGVWRANTYPGAACDVPSHLYSLSFAPGHRWSRRYAPQADILDYLNEVADDFGLRPHIRLNTEVERATFDEPSGTWEVETGDGEREPFDAVITACGQLTNPATPSIEGIGDFEGTIFHSAEWDHEHDLTGERVAVIGTGASAIQFVPPIAESVAHLDIYQRSAPWILPKMDRGYPAWEQGLMRRFPARVALPRLGLFSFFELGTYAFTGTDWLMDLFGKRADSYRENELEGDPELLEKATPDYKIGCKRVLFSSDWYATLRRENVDLLTDEVERITANGVLTKGGVERPVDTIIWGTGFRSHDFVAPMDVAGIDGRDLNAVWQERPEAYLGMAVHGFPNFFVLYGPNTNHGSGSVPYTLECQFNFALDALRHLRAGRRYVDVKAETQERWREEIAERSVPTRWMRGGCDSWYINGEGVNTNNWPGPWLEFRRRTRRLDPAEFRLVG